jgi:toxin ParE1/3/4
MKLIFSSETRADLINIGDTIALDNPLRALSFIEELQAKCVVLIEMPFLYPLVLGYEARNIRRIVHGNYLVFYRSQNDVVAILRVLHSAMDYDSVLF